MILALFIAAPSAAEWFFVIGSELEASVVERFVDQISAKLYF